MATGTVMSSRQPGATSCSSGRSRPSVRARASVRLLPFRRSCARAHSASLSLSLLFLILSLSLPGAEPRDSLRVFWSSSVRIGAPGVGSCASSIRIAARRVGSGASSSHVGGPGARSVGIGVSGRGDPARVPSARVPSGLARGMWAPARVRSGLTRGPLNSAQVPLTTSRHDADPPNESSAPSKRPAPSWLGLRPPRRWRSGPRGPCTGRRRCSSSERRSFRKLPAPASRRLT
jgi:hypothetical protein